MGSSWFGIFFVNYWALLAPPNISYVLIFNNAVYDVSFAYKHQCPNFLDVLFGVDPSEVHMHVRRIPVNEIPETESEAAAWLIHTFQIKDQLLSDFNYHGHFPNQGTEGEVSIMKYLANFSVVIALTGIFTFLTFFSSIWFKIHVSLVCAYIASTFFDIRPSTFLGLLNKASRKRNE